MAEEGRAVEEGAAGPEDTVVLLVTGDGLKTPQAIAHRVRPIPIEADEKALLERLAASA